MDFKNASAGRSSVLYNAASVVYKPKQTYLLYFGTWNEEINSSTHVRIGEFGGGIFLQFNSDGLGTKLTAKGAKAGKSITRKNEVQYILNTYGINTNSQFMGTFEMKESTDFKGLYLLKLQP